MVFFKSRQRLAFTVTAVLLAAVFLLSFVGCKGKEVKDEDKLSVVCTIFPQYDFAEIIGGQYVEVSQLLPSGAESHSYEPTPKDIVEIQQAELFIYVGGENDHWAEDILSSMGEDAPRTLTLMSCVSALEEVVVEGMQLEHEHEHEDEAEYDEHVWTDPNNAILIVRAIQRELSALDEAHSEEFERNAAAYVQKLVRLNEEFKDMVQNAARNIIIVGDRFPFRYLAQAYGLEYYAAFLGCSSDVELSARTIAFLTDKVKEQNIPVVFYIEFSDRKVADAIVETSGAKTLLLHSCHNISREERQNGVSYLSLMEQNLENLREALQP